MLTKEQQIRAILMIRQGLITADELKPNPRLEVTAVLDSGLSDRVIHDCNGKNTGLRAFKKYRDDGGKVYYVDELPPLFLNLSIFFLRTDGTEKEDGPVTEIIFHDLDSKQKIHIALLKNKFNGTI